MICTYTSSRDKARFNLRTPGILPSWLSNLLCLDPASGTDFNKPSQAKRNSSAIWCQKVKSYHRETVHVERQEGKGLTVTPLTRGTMMGTGGGQLLTRSPESHSRWVGTVLPDSQAGPNCDVSCQQDTGIRDIGSFHTGQIPGVWIKTTAVGRGRALKS